MVFTGDLLFNGGTPFALMGSVSGWIEVLETVLLSLAPMRNGAGPGLCRCDGAAFGRDRAAGRRD